MSHSLATQEQAPSVALLMPEIGTTQEQTIAQPVGEVQVPGAISSENVNNKRDFAGVLGRSLAVIGSSAVIAAGFGGTISTETASAKSPSEASCRKKALARPNGIKVKNYHGQVGRYLMSWTAPDMKNCNSKGVRRIRFGFDIKPRPSEDYTPSIFYKELTNNRIDLSRGQLFNQVVRCGRANYDKNKVTTRPTFHSTWKPKRGEEITKTHYAKTFNGCKRIR